MKELKNWTEVSPWYYRYVVSANVTYEMFIEYWDEETPIETAKASLCIVENCTLKNEKSIVKREWLKKELPIHELLEIAYKDDKENKMINIAELLKLCPKGMKLDCTMYEDVYLNHVDELGTIYCYIQHETHKTSITFNRNGTYNSNEKAKCVIFPKGKTTWEGFVPPHVFDAVEGDDNHPYVDLGLSVKWATCNVGAMKPEGCGDYFAWGETESKNEYTLVNSKTYGDSMCDIICDARNDVARAKWGGGWRMPTMTEMEELKNKCQWEWTDVNGAEGYKVTGPNGNNIFLPAVGYRTGSNLIDFGFFGGYWSSTPCEYGYNALSLDFFDDKNPYVERCERHCGQSVRPVKD